MKPLDFGGYRAKAPGARPGLRTLLRNLTRDVLFGPLSLPYGTYRQKRLLRDCERADDHTYTCFLRAPAQLGALIGPVLDFLEPARNKEGPLRLLMFACSNGAEVYTIASWLLMRVPDLDFRIMASDLHPEMVERCKAAEYSRAEALHSEYITEQFVEATFDQLGDRYVVKPHIRERTTFTQANLLDQEALDRAFAPADIVTAQNVLFHLERNDARRAFGNLVHFLKPRGALFVEGMDPALRVELSKAHGLSPLTHDLRRIYSETRVHTPSDWWNYYWGSEPYFPFRADKERRYATIFLRSS